MKSYQLTDGKEPISIAEIDYLAELALMLPSNPIIAQIGAATGVFTCTLLEVRPDAVLYSIDIEECYQEFENVHRLGLQEIRVKRIKGDSADIGQYWTMPVDMVFIDGDHFGAWRDLPVWSAKVKPGGVLALHDYLEVTPPNNPGSVFSDVNNWLKTIDDALIEKLGEVERVIAFRML